SVAVRLSGRGRDPRRVSPPIPVGAAGSRPSHYSNSRGKTSRPMRLLLDEHLPIGLAAEFPGHAVHTVSGRGWTGIKNGELLRRMNGQYDALVTMDRSVEFQQRIATLRFG